MTLLEQLVDGAAGDTIPVATLLRQLKVVAARTDTPPLDQWVRHELEGYPNTDGLPDYRGPFDVIVLGDFLGPFNSGLRNVPIPPMTFPEDWRKGPLFQVSFTEPVAELERMAEQDDYRTVWSPDVVRAYNARVEQGKIQRTVVEGHVLAQATRAVPGATIAAVLDNVRTRILDLALRLEQAAPAAGQPDAAAESKAQATQVINNYFNGSATNVAIGSTNVTQTAHLPAPGDQDALLRYLGAAGVPPHDLVELEQALDADRTAAGGTHPAGPGAKVMAWAARFGADLASNAAGGMIAAGLGPVIGHALKAFFGG